MFISATFSSFHSTKFRDKSQLPSHPNPTSQRGCDKNMLIPATSSYFPNTSPEKCGDQKHTSQREDSEPVPTSNPLVKIPTTQVQRDGGWLIAGSIPVFALLRGRHVEKTLVGLKCVVACRCAGGSLEEGGRYMVRGRRACK
jgi:hypothetical protein